MNWERVVCLAVFLRLEDLVVLVEEEEGWGRDSASVISMSVAS